MTPTGPTCVNGHLHPYGPEAVFHTSMVPRICPGCDRGNEERAERAKEEERRASVDGLTKVQRREKRRKRVFAEGELVLGAIHEERQDETTKEKGEKDVQRGFYWGRGDGD